MSEQKELYLDGGVLLNIFATGRAEEIVRASKYRCVTLSEVACERFAFVDSTMRTVESHVHSDTVFDISTVPSLDIHQFDLREHQVEVVAFAVVFPDVYANLLAVASSKDAALATDDDCVRHLMRDMAPDIMLLDTPELMRNWQLRTSVSDHEVGQAVYRVTTLAQFEITKNHRLRVWWDERLQQAW